MTGTLTIAATSGDWRNAVRVAVGLGLGADDCYAASDAAWDAGDLRAAKALARAAAWFSESPAERRRSRAFPAPESIGTDPIGEPERAASLPQARDHRRHDARPGTFCVCDACAYTGSARGAW